MKEQEQIEQEKKLEIEFLTKKEQIIIQTNEKSFILYNQINELEKQFNENKKEYLNKKYVIENELLQIGNDENKKEYNNELNKQKENFDSI